MGTYDVLETSLLWLMTDEAVRGAVFNVAKWLGTFRGLSSLPHSRRRREDLELHDLYHALLSPQSPYSAVSGILLTRVQDRWCVLQPHVAGIRVIAVQTGNDERLGEGVDLTSEERNVDTHSCPRCTP